jgi:tripartite-type tricarboxylate transporter receptor subunit TctC
MLRRHALALPFLAPLAARAQGFSRPIRIVVPFAAGGAADSATRAVVPGLSARLGQPVVVENRTGAGGSLGGGEVARAAPDGHTLLMDASSHLVNPALLRGLNFDYATAFVPVTLVASFPQVLAVKSELPARTLAEFIALARRQPLNIGTQGNATAGHVGLVQFSRAAGIEVQHIPYRGGADAARDLAAGTLDGTFITMLSAGPIVDSGWARFLAVSAPARVALRPEVPTFAEAGTPGITLSEWVACSLPPPRRPRSLRSSTPPWSRPSPSRRCARVWRSSPPCRSGTHPPTSPASFPTAGPRWRRWCGGQYPH